MSNSTSDPDDKSEQKRGIEQIYREQAGNTCEGDGCDEADDLSVFSLADDGSVSIDSLALLCDDCHRERTADYELTESDVLEVLDNRDIPFVTTSMVAEETSVSPPTARSRLSSLVTKGELERYVHNERQKFYFYPDYESATDVIDGLREHIDLSELDPEAVEAFARQPYKILPRGEGEYYVVVPRFLNFSIGHLHEQDEAWRTYIVNKFVKWFSDLPDALEDEITLNQRYEKAEVDGTTVEFDSKVEREQAWDDFGGQDGPFTERDGDTKIQIQQGREFEVIADLIDGGNLPFVPEPIDPADVRAAPEGVTLREYQQRAWDRFLEYGQIGVYWPMGLGKSWFSLYAGSRIKGQKLVVVPSATLEQQWEDDIEERAPDPDDWEVKTYQYLTHSNGENLDEFQGDSAPTLTIFDEAHYVPADSFSQLSMLPTDYRIGLSGSPYREDGRTEYIFALTGYPTGADWQELVQYGFVDYPEVHVYTYRTQRQKKQDLYDLVGEKPGNGIIFCDSRDLGSEISEALEIPFVHGETPPEDRIDLLEENRVTVASRVADEGMSISNLDWSIEFDFLGSSRRQEMQRTGRLMHATDASDGIHIIMMTDRELDEFGDRLLSLQEKGFGVEFQRRE